MLGVLGAALTMALQPIAAGAATDPPGDYDAIGFNGNGQFAGPVGGGYSFSSGGITGGGGCTGTSGAPDLSSTPAETISCTITSFGTYTPIGTCDNLTLVGGATVSGTEGFNTTYTAVLLGGQGPVQGLSQETVTSDGETDGGALFRTAGYFVIAPLGGGLPPCNLAGFTIIGTLGYVEQVLPVQ